MNPNSEPRNKSTDMQLTGFWWGWEGQCPRIYNGETIVSSPNDGKLEIHTQKNATYTTHKSRLRIDERLERKTRDCKTPRRKRREKSSWHWSWKLFCGYETQSTGNQSKKKETRLRQMKKLLHSFSTAPETTSRGEGNLQDGRRHTPTTQLTRG